MQIQNHTPQSENENNTVGIIIGFAGWRTSFSSLANVCHFFNLMIFFFSSAVCIFNWQPVDLFLSDAKKDQKLKILSMMKITRFYSKRVYLKLVMNIALQLA